MTITLAQVRETLRQVVADFGPDTTYTARYEAITGYPHPEYSGCSYQVDGTPACIVGVVLDRLGVPLDEQWEASGPSTWDPDYREASVVHDIAEQVGLTADARDYLARAQNAQDNGYTWGYALHRAEGLVNK